MSRLIFLLVSAALLLLPAHLVSNRAEAGPRLQATATRRGTTTPRPTRTARPSATRTATATPRGATGEEEQTIRVTEPLTGTLLPRFEDSEEANEARTLAVVGRGEVTGVPDRATITLGVETIGADVGAAVEENNRTVEAIQAVIEELEIPARNVQTSQFHVFIEPAPPAPAEGEPPAEGEGQRFHVSQQLTVLVEELEENQALLGTLIEQAVGAGANNIFGPNFQINNDRTLRQQAQRAAVQEAYARAQEWATLTGVELIGVKSVRELDQGATPPPAAEGLGGAPPLQVGALTLTERVEIIFYIE